MSCTMQPCEGEVRTIMLLICNDDECSSDLDVELSTDVGLEQDLAVHLAKPRLYCTLRCQLTNQFKPNNVKMHTWQVASKMSSRTRQYNVHRSDQTAVATASSQISSSQGTAFHVQS